MNEIFLMTVDAVRQTDRGLYLFPPLSGGRRRYEKVERIKVETPAKVVFEYKAMFSSRLSEVPPKSFYWIVVLGIKESDVPPGSKIWLLNKTEEQLALSPFTKEAKEKAIAKITELVESLPADLQKEILEFVRNVKTDDETDGS